jgi:hypothetical protein
MTDMSDDVRTLMAKSAELATLIECGRIVKMLNLQRQGAPGAMPRLTQHLAMLPVSTRNAVTAALNTIVIDILEGGGHG